MVEKYTIRTDLAMEQKERFESDHVEVSGVVLEEEYDEEKEIKITTVKIETENGAKTMGKPVGTYLTLEAPNLAAGDEGYHREISETLAGFLAEYMQDENKGKEQRDRYSVLVVGLGNREVTPDALGPVCGRSVEYYQTYRAGIRKICHRRRKWKKCQRSRAGRNGTDRHGDGRNHKRDCTGDQSGSYHGNRCTGCKKYEETEPDDTDIGCRDSPGSRSREPQKCNYKRYNGDSCHSNRSTDSCGCSNDCKRHNGKLYRSIRNIGQPARSRSGTSGI